MKITIVEDDIKLAEKIAKKLQKNNYIVAIYNSKEKFIENCVDNSDLYILDLNLSGSPKDGFDIITYLRKVKKSRTPIIITSGYDDLENKVY